MFQHGQRLDLHHHSGCGRSSGDLLQLLLEMPLCLAQQVLHTLCCNAFQGLYCMSLSFFRCRSLRNHIVPRFTLHNRLYNPELAPTVYVTVGREIIALPVNQLLGISNGTGIYVQ